MKREIRGRDWFLIVGRFVYIGLILLAVMVVLWPVEENAELTQLPQEIVEVEEEPAPPKVEEPKKTEPVKEITTKKIESYNAKRMTHYVMDGNDANTCIAGRWCIGKQLTVAEDTSVRYKGYYVYAVHCSVVKEWRGSLIKVYYKDGGVETGIILDCGGFAGHKDRMDKAMGARYNGKRDNYTLSRYITKTEVIRKGW